MFLATLILTIGASFSATATENPGLEFIDPGQAPRKVNAAQLRADTPVEMMKVYEPQEAALKNYRGYPVLPLLKKIYGTRLDKADTVSFYCEDGYRADIALSEFKDKKSLLAFAMEDGSAFALKSPKGPIPLAPFYLVWDHPNAAAAQKDVYRWPYAVTQIEVIESKTAYQPLAAPKDFDEGHRLFMQNCFSCHAINGAGGRRGPPLNAFVQQQKEGFLLNYILDPKKMNPASQMSGLSKDLKDRHEVALKIIAYLKKISR